MFINFIYVPNNEIYFPYLFQFSSIHLNPQETWRWLVVTIWYLPQTCLCLFQHLSKLKHKWQCQNIRYCAIWGFKYSKVGTVSASIHITLYLLGLGDTQRQARELISGPSLGKSVPLQAWSGPEGSRNLRFPDYVTMARGSGKVVSPTHWPPLPPGNTPGTHFY